MKTLINAAAAIAFGTLAIAAVPASARAPTATVSYADLNLSSAEGTAIFDRRIKRAIQAVCGGEAPRDVGSRRIYNTCLADTGAAVQPKRDLAVAEHRAGRLAAKGRVIRFAAN